MSAALLITTRRTVDCPCGSDTYLQDLEGNSRYDRPVWVCYNCGAQTPRRTSRRYRRFVEARQAAEQQRKDEHA